jgi:AcrR family transcriptional regulator
MGDARTLLVDAAERLFGERGIDGVSLREVGAAAGQRNTSAALYHFGSKDALVDAVFDRRMASVNADRLARLAALDETDRGHDPVALVEAFVEPFFAVVGAGTAYARFCAQVLAEPGNGVVARLDRPVMTSLRMTLERLDAALAPDPLRGERLRLLGVLVVHGLADRERLLATGQPTVPAADALAALRDAAIALVTPALEPT